MATFGTQTGFWVDWRDGPVRGPSITLTARNSNIVIAAASLWVGNILAGWVWATVATIIYRRRSRTKVRDGVHVQHQLIWRNSGDPLTAALDNLDVYLHRSKRWKLFKQRLINVRRWTPGKSTSAPGVTTAGSSSTSKLSSSPKFDRIRRRSLWAFSTPLAIWAAFFVSGVFVSYIATPNHDVLARSNLDSCGIWNISAANRPDQDQTTAQTQVEIAYAAKVLNDTLNGRNYARSCYANDLGNLNPVSCSIYTKPTLATFTAQDTRFCPFQYYPGEPFDGSVCDVPHSQGAFAMWTGTLDSSVDLGINAHEENAVGFEKKVNCSVLSLSNRTATNTKLGFDTQANVTYTAYLFGGYKDYVGNNITYFTDVAASQSNNYGYQVKAVYSYAGVPEQDWIPAPPFDLIDGDVSLFFFAANSVGYVEKVYDPYFWATDPVDTAVGLSKPLRYYAPINPVAVMGCVDQYAICDSSKADAHCTEPGGIVALGPKIEGLHLNLHQYVTALRIAAIFQDSDTYSSAYGTGTAALKASDRVLGVLSSGLPPNQWKIEVLGWFQTSLAKMQAYAVEFVINTADLGPFGRVSFLRFNSSTLPIWQKQCRSQRIANTGQYQVFSFLGIMVLVCVGICAYCIKKVIEYLANKKKTPNDVYLADNKFQLQRMVLEVPVLNPDDEFPVYDPSHTHIRLPTPNPGGGVTYLSQHNTSSQLQTSPQSPTPAQVPTSNTPSAPGTSTAAPQTSTTAPQTATTATQLSPTAPQTSPIAPQSSPAQQSAPASQPSPTQTSVPSSLALAPVTQSGASHSVPSQTTSGQASQLQTVAQSGSSQGLSQQVNVTQHSGP